jgi:putative methionine-R-sulfoxide reductase with GAF domain
MSSGRTSGALEAIDRILNRGGDADDVLREVVATLAGRAGYSWAGISFVEGDRLTLGPQAGGPAPDTRTTWPVAYRGERVAELAVDGAGDEDRAFLERVATLISAHCLVGWDTGGEEWRP